MRCVAVDRLRLDGRVPPGVEQEDVVGGGQVEAEAAGLEADEEDAAVRVRLEALHARRAVARLAVEVLVDEAGRVQPRLQEREEARELREDERLVPLLDDLVEARHEDVELGARALRAPRVDEARVAGGLPQPQERLEHLDLRPREALRARRGRAAPRGSGRAARRTAPSARARGRSRASARSSAGRSFATCSLVRRRMNGRDAPREGVACPPRRARRRRGREATRPRRAARVQELEEAPQLAEVVLDRRAA